MPRVTSKKAAPPPVFNLPAPFRKWGPYFILVMAVIAAYGNVFDNAFLYDDKSLILKNIFLQDWHSIGSIFTTSITGGAGIEGGFYRPLQILLYFFVYQLAGPMPFAFHLLNVALHAANACLVYRLGRGLRFRPLAAMLAALLWAVHPVHIEVITYMSGTADPLYAFFCLLGMIALVPRFKPQGFCVAAAMMVLALLSKEEAITFPLMAMTCIFLLDSERFKPKTYLRTWPFWVIALVYFVLHQLLSFSNFDLHREHDLYSHSILCRIYTFLATLPSYLGFMVWPIKLHFDRNFPPVETPFHLPVLAGAVIVLLASAQIFMGRSRRALALSWGLLWFAATDLLHTGILIPVNASLLEHWLYLPSIGLVLGAAQWLASVKVKLKQRKPVETSIVVLVAVVLGVITYQQNMVWHDPITLYLNIFKNGEPSPHAHNNLAIEYTRLGDYREALEQYELAIELSGDTNAQAHHNLAITLLNGPDGQRFSEEAIRHLKRALEIDPGYYPAANALAVLYERKGEEDQADFYRHMAAQSYQKLTGRPLAP